MQGARAEEVTVVQNGCVWRGVGRGRWRERAALGRLGEEIEGQEGGEA